MRSIRSFALVLALGALSLPAVAQQKPNDNTHDRLAKELAAILARPDIREKYAKLGLPVVAEGPDAFRARIGHEVPLYKEVIDQAGCSKARSDRSCSSAGAAPGRN